MKKALFVIDLQEDFIGEQRNKKRFCYKNDKKLIESTNQEIEKNDKEGNSIIYIKQMYPMNFFFTKVMKLSNTDLVKGLKIGSNHIFTKSKPSAFSNPDLVQFLQEQEVNTILITGIDEGGCVSATAWEANKLGFKVEVLVECVDTVFDRKVLRYRKKLKAAGVEYC